MRLEPETTLLPGVWCMVHGVSYTMVYGLWSMVYHTPWHRVHGVWSLWNVGYKMFFFHHADFCNPSQRGNTLEEEEAHPSKLLPTSITALNQGPF